MYANDNIEEIQIHLLLHSLIAAICFPDILLSSQQIATTAAQRGTVYEHHKINYNLRILKSSLQKYWFSLKNLMF